ncbi:cysteine hydrolase family protein [Agromyces seonyuensis]|uniref:Isochorismatase family protein n=1 Tax=Agromyces seonyuensis TaxID=2662446 RepID=A0A6I4P801_9MICO|nr:cysteine hydrolase family protein [Agromyces seonyuensis]MWB99957.1 isochorismatase family protein [Agromyces seonyuensis]
MTRVLVIIDIQNDYFPGGAFPLVGTEAAAGAAGGLLAAFRAAGEPVIHVQHFSGPDDGFFVPGTPGAEINAAVAPVPGEPVVVKHEPNAFLGTDLEARLRALAPVQVVVAGMMTSMCVDATVRAASDLGFALAVAGDACAAPDLTYAGETVPGAQVHAAFLAALDGTYARVAPAAELAPVHASR